MPSRTFGSAHVPTEFRGIFQTATKIAQAQARGLSASAVGVAEADSERVTTAVSDFLQAECVQDG
jgi:hypothetical protein